MTAELQTVIETLHDNDKFNAVQQEVRELNRAAEDHIDKAYKALIEQTNNHDPSLLDHGCKIPELVGLIGQVSNHVA